MKRDFCGVKYDNFTSFLVSVLIYIFVILFLLYKATFSDLNIKYTDDKNAFMDVIAIDIDEDAPTRTAKEVVENSEPEKAQPVKEPEKVEPEKVVKPEKAVEPEKIPEPTKEPEKVIEPKPEPKKEEPKKQNLKDLFAKTTKDNKKLQTKTETSDKKAEKTGAKQSTGTISDKDSGKSQLTGVYDAFKGGVRKKLTALWSRYNGGAYADARVSITISADGKLTDYEILSLSLDSGFNQKLRTFMENLLDQDFPKPPNGEAYIFKDLQLTTEL